jgi:hypothetical protein
VEATDGDGLQPILSDLGNALHQQVDDVKRMVAEERVRQIVGFGKSDSRRKASSNQSSSVAQPCAPSIF